jgi:hypothetical protein
LSFSGTLLQSAAADNERKSANMISYYVRSFCRKGPENRLLSKSGFPWEFGQKVGIYYNPQGSKKKEFTGESSEGRRKDLVGCGAPAMNGSFGVFVPWRFIPCSFNWLPWMSR